MEHQSSNGTRSNEMIQLNTPINCQYQLHEIPKLVNFLGKTQGRYYEAKKWDTYYKNYMNYLEYCKRYSGYSKNNSNEKQMSKPFEPHPPMFYANSESDVLTTRPYKRPVCFQNSGKSYNPSKVVYRGSTKDLEYNYNQNQNSNLSFKYETEYQDYDEFYQNIGCDYDDYVEVVGE